MPTMVITGDKALNRKLKKLTGPQAKKIVTKASRVAMKNIQFAARQNVPVESGLLSRSMKIRAKKRSRRSFGVVMRVGWTGSDDFYGGFVEYGTKFIKGRDYLRQAVDDNKDKTLSRYRNEIRRGLTALAKHG